LNKIDQKLEHNVRILLRIFIYSHARNCLKKTKKIEKEKQLDPDQVETVPFENARSNKSVLNIHLLELEKNIVNLNF